MPLRFHQRQAYERFPQTARIDACQLSLGSAFAFRLLFPYGLSVMSRSIGEPLANSTLHGASGTLYVIYAEPDAIAISEIKFRQIAVQMLLFAMLVDAFHAALEDRIVSLDGVGRDYPLTIVANIFIDTMLDGFMAGESLTDVLIMASLIGHQRSLASDVIADDRVNLSGAGILNMEATRAALPLNESKDRVFVAPSATALALAVNSSDESFVSFYGFARAAHRGHADNAHGFTDTVRHEPCGFESYAKGSVKLVARNSLFGRAKQIHRLKPQVHRDVAILKNGADLHGELFAALVALVEANAGRFTGHLADPVEPPAIEGKPDLATHTDLNPREAGGFGLRNLGGQNRIDDDTCFTFINQGHQGRLGL